MCSKNFGKYPYEIKRVDFEKFNISEESSNYLKALVLVGPQKIVLPEFFIHEAEYYRNFPLREDDVFVMGHPRSGTTLTQELLWMVFNDFNFKLASKMSTIQRVPILETQAIFSFKNATYPPPLTDKIKTVVSTIKEDLENITTRRVIKTHLLFDFLPENLLTSGCKVIYLARNPRDVVVSHYHLQKSIGRFRGSFENYLTLFMSDSTTFGPYWTHVQQGWERRSSENVLFLFYEDLLQDKKNYIGKIFEFVGEKLTPFQLDLLDFVSDFDNFKKYFSQGIDKHINNAENTNKHFIRKGQIGNNIDCFTKKMGEEFDKWYQKNLASTDIKFPVRNTKH